MLGRCPVGLPDLGFANTGLEGPAGSQGSAPKLGPEACYREEFETAAAPGLLNWYGRPSASEVGLNFWPRRGQQEAFGPGWCHQPGLKGCIGTGSWHQPGPMPHFSPSWCHQPEPKAATSRPLCC